VDATGRVGHVDGVVLALGALGAQIKAGTLRGLATSNTVAEYADIPTLKELGYKEDLFGVWFSFLAPAGIPEDARKALVAAVEEAGRTGRNRLRFSAPRLRANAGGLSLGRWTAFVVALAVAVGHLVPCALAVGLVLGDASRGG